MNKTPTPRYTPLELAQRDRQFWLSRVKELNDELFRAEEQFAVAEKKIAQLRCND